LPNQFHGSLFLDAHVSGLNAFSMVLFDSPTWNPSLFSLSYPPFFTWFFRLLFFFFSFPSLRMRATVAVTRNLDRFLSFFQFGAFHFRCASAVFALFPSPPDPWSFSQEQTFILRYFEIVRNFITHHTRTGDGWSETRALASFDLFSSPPLSAFRFDIASQLATFNFSILLIVFPAFFSLVFVCHYRDLS